MRLLLLSLICCLAVCFLPAQDASDPQLDIEIPEGPKPWTSLDLNNSQRNFQFAIVTDRTGGRRPGIFMEGVRRLNLIQPEFVMSVGDLIDGYTEDVDELNRQWNEFDGFVDSLEMPFFYIPGNHDITNEVMNDLWKKRLGPTYYHFKYQDVLFLCLNSEDQYRGSNRGTISDEQYDYIKATLEANTDVRWTLVFFHQPLWILEDTKRWKDVEALLANRNHNVFVGHHHRYAKYERNNGKYFMLATTGGGSGLRGARLGEFDHVVWVTMTDEGPIIANLQLDGIWDENVVTDKTKQFIADVSDKNVIEVEPMFYNQPTFQEGVVKLKVTNDEDVPMIVNFTEGFSWDLRAEVENKEITIQPNSVEFVDVNLSSRKRSLKKPVGELEAVKLAASVEYQAEDMPDLAIPFSFNLAPEEQLRLQRADGPITIDGNLKEWTEFPYAWGAEDPTDASGVFNVHFDDNFMYFAAKVTDDDIQVDTANVAWQQDYIGIVLNADPLARSAMRRGQGWYRESLSITMTPATSTMPSSTSDSEDTPDGINFACQVVEGGYVMEAAIPMSYVKEKQGDNWQTARINMIIQDRDAGEDKRPRYRFKKDWRGRENRVGSGMFFRDEER